MKHESITHFLTGNEFSKAQIEQVLTLSLEIKKNPAKFQKTLLGESVALIFEKPSLRTRFSFTVAVNQLGGHVIESVSQTRKSEEPKDLIRVLQGYCSALMMRTYEDSALLEMKQYATIPIINGLTDCFHPCQSLADLLTLKEQFSSLEHLKIAYIGDGNNVLSSFMIMAVKMGIQVHYCCPPGYQPDEAVLSLLENRELAVSFNDPKQAVAGCHAVYTDVWTSMGDVKKDDSVFAGYQVNEALMSKALNNAVFMHCMPMERGKEVSVDLPDAPCSVIFKQSENRMHAQKALLVTLLKGDVL